MALRERARPAAVATAAVLFSAAAFAAAFSYPLELKVAFAPCLCGGKAYLFSTDGRNQTLGPSDEAPNCNLVPVDPVLPPVCSGGRACVADRSGKLLALTESGPEEILSFTGAAVGLFAMDGGPVLVTEDSVLKLGSAPFAVPFRVLSAHVSGSSLLLFGEKEMLLCGLSGQTRRVPFSAGKVSCAATLKGRIIAGAGQRIVFIREDGQVHRTFLLKAEAVSIEPAGEDLVAVASSDHFVRLFDLKGNVLWQARLGGRILGLWKTAKGLLAAVGGANRLALLETSEGREVWTFELKGGEMGLKPFLSEGRVAFYSFSENYEPYLNIVELPS